MRNGPEQDPDDKGGEWKDFTEYDNSKSGASPFQYNPAARDITPSSGDFPETDDVEAPEKM